MKTLSQFAIRLTALAIVVSLGGCLSKETAATSAAPDPGGTSNRAPTISGNPPSAVLIGTEYSFTPQASDPDGDTLIFSIDSKPAWANFNSSTGNVSGTPTLGDVGMYSNVRVSVSDGQLSASMPGFAIDVTQVATASTTLSWTAPTQNSDGSSLTDLAGYRIYFGQSSGNYTNQIAISNPSITSYFVDNLSPATYYFAATSINSSGIESQYSNEAFRDLL